MGGLAHSPFDVAFGESLPIAFEVSNIGQTVVNGLNVQVTSGGVNIDSFTINEVLIPGESALIETDFMLPSTFAPQTQFIITVTPQGLVDINMDDNSRTIVVGHTLRTGIFVEPYMLIFVLRCCAHAAMGGTNQ